MAGHSVDDYLETIYFLAFPIGEYHPTTGSSAIAARVAEMLGVSRASAGEMLKRLEADGLVERGEQKEAILTDDRHRAGGEGRPQAPDHRAVPHGLHGLYARGVARPGRRARRHVHGRHDRAHQRAARAPGSLPARLASGHRRSSTPRTRSSFRSPRSRRESARPSCGSPSTTASSSTGSTPRGSSPGPPSTSTRHAEPSGEMGVAVEGNERAVGEAAAEGLFVRKL